MKIQLISETAPCAALQAQGIRTAEDLIVYAARVSNPDNQLNTETGARLLLYCIRHGHWSVFETASMTVEIVTSRAIAAQLLRHRSFTFQEFSQRYAEASDFELVELRKQAATNRQSSSEDIMNEKLTNEVREYINDAIDNYEYLLEKGVARECARMILPLCTRTTLYMTGSCRSWIHYLELGRSEHTQKEHRDIARAIQEVFGTVFPTVSKALSETTE